MLRRLLDMLYAGAGYLAGVCLVAILLMMLALALGREIGINVRSGDDIASWFMAALAFLGLAHTFKRGDMIRVELLLERLGPRTRRVMEVVCLSVGLAFITYFAWHAWQFVRFSYVMNEMSTGVLVVPMWIPQVAFFAGLSILAIAMLDELVSVLAGRPPSYRKEPPATPEELLKRVTESGSV